MLQHTVRFGQGYLANNNVTKVSHPPNSSNLFPTDSYLSFNWNKRWKNDTFLLLLTSWRMRWKNWNCLAKWLPGRFPTFLLSLAEGSNFTRGLLERKPILNDRNIFYFSEIKWFLGYFEAPQPKITFRGLPTWYSSSLLGACCKGTVGTVTIAPICMYLNIAQNCYLHRRSDARRQTPIIPQDYY